MKYTYHTKGYGPRPWRVVAWATTGNVTIADGLTYMEASGMARSLNNPE